MTYSLLGNFKIDSNTIKKLWYVRDMVEEMKDRIVLFRGDEGDDRNKKIFETVIKQIETQKTKHFL